MAPGDLPGHPVEFRGATGTAGPSWDASQAAAYSDSVPEPGFLPRSAPSDFRARRERWIGPFESQEEPRGTGEPGDAGAYTPPPAMTEQTAQIGEPTSDEVETSRMSLGDHLDELRRRLFRSAIAVVLFFVVAWSFNEQLKVFTEGPWTQAKGMLNELLIDEAEAALEADPTLERTEYFLTSDPEDKRLISGIDQPLYGRGVGTGFMLRLKICFFAALAVGGPYLLWEMWGFIAAGLYKHERRTVLAYFPTSILLFYGGIAFAYFLMLPYGIYFLNRMDPDMLRLGVEANDYLTFFTRMSVGQGVVFQLPVVMTALARVDIVSPAAMAKFRGHFVVLAFILGAIFTPGDPYTQFGMAVPMVLLYEVGIWTSRLAARKVQARTEELLAS